MRVKEGRSYVASGASTTDAAQIGDMRGILSSFFSLSYKALALLLHIVTTSTHTPRLPQLSLERMGWPAVKFIGLDKNLDQMVLFMWVREAIPACDPG